MFEGQLLVGKLTSYSVFSPWFERGGDSVTCTLEQIETSGLDITVELYTKKADDSGRGQKVDASVTIVGAGAGRVSNTWSTEGAAPVPIMYDLVRYEFVVPADEGGWVLFRMLSPVWFDEA